MESKNIRPYVPNKARQIVHCLQVFAKALKSDLPRTEMNAVCENYFSKMLIIKRSAGRADSFWQHLELVKVLDAVSMLCRDVKLRHNAQGCTVLLSGINPSRHNAKGARSVKLSKCKGFRSYCQHSQALLRCESRR